LKDIYPHNLEPGFTRYQGFFIGLYRWLKPCPPVYPPLERRQVCNFIAPDGYRDLVSKNFYPEGSPDYYGDQLAVGRAHCSLSTACLYIGAHEEFHSLGFKPMYFPCIVV
jgi:hypothetical protein